MRMDPSFKIALFFLLSLWLRSLNALGQDNQAVSNADKIAGFPVGIFSKISKQSASLEDRLTTQTERYLEKMAKREARIRCKLFKVDSAAAIRLFGNSEGKYAAMLHKLKCDTGSHNMPVNGEFQPYNDSLKVSLSFLQQQPQWLNNNGPQEAYQKDLQSSISQLQALQAKMQDADQIKQFVRDRKEQIKQLITQYTQLPPGITNEYQGLNQDLYYYSQQIQQYRDMMNDPDKMAQKAFQLLNQLPSFQQFMKNNSLLSGLFSLPGNYGSATPLTGLQTRDQITQLIQGQVSSGGSAGAAALQSNLESAQSQLDNYKDKLGKWGAGGGDVDLPDFKRNEQKTKTFLKRLVYGVNFQTTKSTYFYPTIGDLGLSIGYKLNGSNVIGVGASYKMGLGSGWNHMAFSSQGLGLRSFIDMKLKGSFFLSGGYEYNYVTPFSSFQQISRLSEWNRSGLLGLSKIVSVKSKVFKKTKVQLLWDLLSYQQIPATQPVIFRMGYQF